MDTSNGITNTCGRMIRTFGIVEQAVAEFVEQEAPGSYLLCLWQESGGDQEQWRASLRSPQSDELQGSAGPDELFAYLREMGLKSEGNYQVPTLCIT
jgi:hypothetical protein